MVGSCIGGKSAAEIRRIQENHLKKDRNKIPLLFARDVIHGYRTIYPIGLAMAGSFDPALMTECTEMAAKEAAAGGTHLTYAPMVDLARDARWGRVMESCGEDPLLGVVEAASSSLVIPTITLSSIFMVLEGVISFLAVIPHQISIRWLCPCVSRG